MSNKELSRVELEKLLISFKETYHSVYATTIGEDVFVWRPITSFEYEIIKKTSLGDVMTEEELVCQKAVLYPEVNFALFKAGIPHTLAPQILHESGFTNPKKTHEYLSICRDKTNSDFVTQAEILIASAFPQYRFEEMREWDLEKLLDMVAKAEWKMSMLDGKEFKFESALDNEDEVEEDGPEQSEEEVMKELERKIIEDGGDPIFALYDIYKEEQQYLKLPFIVGSSWNDEVTINAIQEQIQSKSNE